MVCERYENGGVDTGCLKEINAAARYMQARGWISLLAGGEDVAEDGVYGRLKLTPEGIDYGHLKMRRWYRKIWDFFKSDVRTIVVAIVTAIIIALLTTVVLRMLGE